MIARGQKKAGAPDSGPVEKIKWLDDVAGHDYDAAEAYLSLKLDGEAVIKLSSGYAKRRSPEGGQMTFCGRRIDRCPA